MPHCSFLRRSYACLFLLVLTGCSLSSTAVPSADAGLAISGMVRGGQQSIVGAHLYLLAANTTGYGGMGIAPSSSNASISLLTNVPLSTTLDTSGGATNGDYYVTTGAGGVFSITGDYSCTPNTQVYLYALGGNPASGTNAAAGLLAALGNCPSAGNFVTATPYVVINEVSTLAAAYAFAGFATDATHVSSSGTAAAQVGIQNAFANAANLAGISTGLALATTPAGNGTAPQSEINTLANVLASCVNTTGAITGPPTPTTCYTLLNDAQSVGSSGIVPSDTATAAINIAHNPGANIAALYTLGTPTPPFGPALAAQPNDFTVALDFTGGGVNDPENLAIDGIGNAWMTINTGGNGLAELANSGTAVSPSAGFTGGGLNVPIFVAIDALGNAWASNYNNSVTKLSSSGAAISPSTGYTGGGQDYDRGLAVDGSGDAWIPNENNNSVTELSNAGVAISPASGFTGGGLNYPYAIAIDASNSVWIANSGTSISKFSSTGAPITTVAGYTGGGLNGPQWIAIDASGNAWTANYNSNSVSKFSSTGVAISPSVGYKGGGMTAPVALSIDGAGNIWTANRTSSVSEVSNAGVGLSPSAGYLGPLAISTFPNSIAIDGSGNAWMTDLNSKDVTEFVGLAAPVVTPLAVGVKNNTLGTRP